MEAAGNVRTWNLAVEASFSALEALVSRSGCVLDDCRRKLLRVLRDDGRSHDTSMILSCMPA